MFLFCRARELKTGLSAGRHAVDESQHQFFNIAIAGPVNGILALERCCEFPPLVEDTTGAATGDRMFMFHRAGSDPQ